MAGLYIHIPFCKQACHYCNFHFATSIRQKPEVVKAMCNELKGKASAWETHVFETIYFGGGTPSLLNPAELEELLDTMYRHYTIAPHPEITLEANPDDVEISNLNQWKQIGINRISLGIQSFAAADLQWMNRAHDANQAIQSLRLALDFFPNLTADLIYGTPGLTDEQWLLNIDTLTKLGVPHISAYALTVEPKTPLEKQIRLRQKPNTDSDQQARQFILGINKLRNAGYEQYEISNFAKTGFRSRHNSSYWKGIPYLGIGPSAHSYQPPVRSWQVANNHQYIEQIRQQKWTYQSETLSTVQQFNEAVMISLRTAEGLSISKVPASIQKKWNAKLKQFEDQQWLLIHEGHIQLSDVGKLQADGIAAALFLDEEDQIN